MIFFPPAPALAAPAQAGAQLPAPEPPKALPFASLRAEYKWSLRGAKDGGSGTLVVLLQPASGKLVLEVFTFGERLALVDGDAAAGYQVVLPKEQVDRTVAGLADLPLPFLPQTGSVDSLARALAFGEGRGITVRQRDNLGPSRLAYEGLAEDGSALEVELIRKRWLPSN
ncbi:MAG TPA: hypothetical protein VL181_06585 [Holophagaceae bacterium]|nr:hypothetical protein [Holophagaceae bacterium]